MATRHARRKKFDDLVSHNKKMILKDKKLLEEIEEKVENRYLRKLKR
ncbi:FbpB family small basic protein [Peribacillus alkalitolerans]|nr:FbpB family small basic protein [Peribacillus alkalitolerans]